MSSRTTPFLASFVAVAALSACSTPYSDVYSHKKNTFKAPEKPKTEIALPPPSMTDPLNQAPGTVPNADPNMNIPGVSTPAIPGLENPPATPPAPAPADPNMAPGTIPGL